MAFKTLELMKLQRLQKKAERDIQSTKNRKSLEIELMATLEEYLSTADKVMIEITRDADIADFIDLLNESLTQMYDFDQISKDKYIFYNKEIIL